MQNPVLYIPLLTFVLSLYFGAAVYRRFREKAKSGEPPSTHLLWWAGGILVFGAGTFAEGFVTLFGWEEPVFRGWYIVGALLGGAPLAQGSVYLHFSRRTADRMALGLVLYVALAAAFVLIAPVDASAADEHLLSGKVFEWQWVRLFSPLVNTYAFIFLVGGAALSAYRFSRSPATERRALGNVLIAVGAILPGIGGGFTRADYTEVLYVTELIGLSLIYLGYRLNVAKRSPRRVEGGAGGSGLRRLTVRRIASALAPPR